jgi:hypothetical protein
MKYLSIIIASICLLAISAKAQTTNFLSQIYQWGTTFDTSNTTFLSTRGMFDTGVESRQGDGIPLINDLHLSYDLTGATYLTPTNVSVLRLGPDVMERNSGVSGTFVSAEGGLQAAVVHYDFRFGVSVDGGYWANQPNSPHHIFGEASLNAEKALGSRTYTGLRFSQEFPHNAQGFYAQVGFTF